MPLFSIRSKRLMIERRYDKAVRDLKSLQAECEHAFAARVYMEDEYNSEYIREKWNDCKCEDCGKIWIEKLGTVKDRF